MGTDLRSSLTAGEGLPPTWIRVKSMVALRIVLNQLRSSRLGVKEEEIQVEQIAAIFRLAVLTETLNCSLIFLGRTGSAEATCSRNHI